ncbi:PAS domain-containing protein [Halobacteria archaeon AArc-m2/3/4]|uniref:histidine kinase n=1 Tax=Natronoglomus mannanivorans TaxID=2979990 RepID=A0ABT2QFB0_9EURY|nr:PAS domain-containing protein [Halobacteria archaeon AArc-m2/3/4]
MQTRDDSPLHVLYIGADQDSTRSGAAGIERTCDHLSTVAASSRADGLKTLRTREIACVAYECDSRGGDDGEFEFEFEFESDSGFESESTLEFVDAVHERKPHVPVVLVARDAGSEALAVEAFRRGVADYVRAGGEVESPWSTLVDRIDDAIERSRVERNRRRSVAVVENGSDLVCAVDDDGVFTFAAPSVEEVLGYTPSELLDERGLEFVHPEDRDAVRETVRKLVENPTWVPTAEFRVKCADGRWTVIEATCHNHLDEPTIAEITVVGHEGDDETEGQCQLRALHETTRRLMNARTRQEIADITTEAARNVLRLPVNGVYFHDETGDRLVPAAVTRHGEELFDEFPMVERDDGNVWRAFRTGRPQVYDDVTTDSNASTPETSIRSELVLPLGDHGVFVAGSIDVADFEDRTVSLANVLAANVERALDRASRQDELKARERTLAAQNERLERFSSIVAHDLQSPLAVVSGNLDLARTESDDADRYLAEAARTLERMQRIIDDLLWLAREGREIGSVTTVELSRVTRFAWGHVDTEAATLENTQIPNVQFQADEDRTVQLLENLFRNAVEHGSTSRSESRDDSETSVDHDRTSARPEADDPLEYSPSDGDVTVRVDAGDDWFAVEDTGPGVPEPKRDAIFDTGYSTSADGTGYGLSIVETIVTAHGWEIDVTDGVDGGARFEITGIDSLEWGVEAAPQSESENKSERDDDSETDDE